MRSFRGRTTQMRGSDEKLPKIIYIRWWSTSSRTSTCDQCAIEFAEDAVSVSVRRKKNLKWNLHWSQDDAKYTQYCRLRQNGYHIWCFVLCGNKSTSFACIAGMCFWMLETNSGKKNEEHYMRMRTATIFAISFRARAVAGISVAAFTCFYCYRQLLIGSPACIEAFAVFTPETGVKNTNSGYNCKTYILNVMHFIAQNCIKCLYEAQQPATRGCINIY